MGGRGWWREEGRRDESEGGRGDGRRRKEGEGGGGARMVGGKGSKRRGKRRWVREGRKKGEVRENEGVNTNGILDIYQCDRDFITAQDYF